MTWTELSDRFRKLAEITGCDKSSSYSMIVYRDGIDGHWTVELGGYDIPDFNRHHTVKIGRKSDFATEQEAMSATLSAIIAAEESVRKLYGDGVDKSCA